MEHPNLGWQDGWPRLGSFNQVVAGRLSHKSWLLLTRKNREVPLMKGEQITFNDNMFLYKQVNTMTWRVIDIVHFKLSTAFHFLQQLWATDHTKFYWMILISLIYLIFCHIYFLRHDVILIRMYLYIIWSSSTCEKSDSMAIKLTTVLFQDAKMEIDEIPYDMNIVNCDNW